MNFSEIYSTPFLGRVCCLTSAIEVLEGFEDFELAVRASGSALHTSELSIDRTQFDALTAHAGLGGGR